MNSTLVLLAFIYTVQVFTSCRSARPVMAIPDQFAKEATKLSIPENNTGRKSLQLGDYTTSRVKRGWNLTSSQFDWDQHVTMEDRVLRLMGIRKEHFTTKEKDKFQFSIQHQRSLAEVYALERKVTASTRWKTYNKWLSEYTSLNNAEYLFSAAIITSLDSVTGKWELEIYGHQDPSRKSGNMIERLEWEEGGFVTNGTDTMIIRAIKVDKVISPNGQQTTMPFAVFKAYEFRTGDAVAAIVDTFGNNIWISNGLDDQTRLIITSCSVAILMRRNPVF